MAASPTQKTNVLLQVHNHQKSHRIPIRQLQLDWLQALTFLPRPRHPLPPTLDFHLVTSRQIQKIHREFLDDDTPTDVITFPYGEIFICPEVAHRQRKEYQRSLYHEILLYGIHALVHLKGYEDHTPPEFQKMKRIQEKILFTLHPANEI